MAYKLVCIHPFHYQAGSQVTLYNTGQEVTDPAEVATLLEDREHHFVRVAIPDPPTEPPSGLPVTPPTT